MLHASTGPASDNQAGLGKETGTSLDTKPETTPTRSGCWSRGVERHRDAASAPEFGG